MLGVNDSPSVLLSLLRSYRFTNFSEPPTVVTWCSSTTKSIYLLITNMVRGHASYGGVVSNSGGHLLGFLYNKGLISGFFWLTLDLTVSGISKTHETVRLVSLYLQRNILNNHRVTWNSMPLANERLRGVLLVSSAAGSMNIRWWKIILISRSLSVSEPPSS